MKPLIPITLLCWFVFQAQVQAQDLVMGINLQANQTYTNDASESLVYVTGQVLQLATGAQVANETNLIPAASVEVRFWQPDSPNVFFTAQTDVDGNYVLGLNEGVWVGEACGSNQGYFPAAWHLLVENQRLKTMQAVASKRIELDYLTPSNLVNQHAMVTLNGSGFGCNGSLVFTYSNSVDRCDKALPVEYQQQPIRLNNSDFDSRTDTELRFQMPALDSNRNVSKHVAFVHYEQGGNRSDRIPIGEAILASQANNSVLCGGEPAGAETSVTELADVTTVVVNLPGSVNPDGTPGDPQLGGGNNPNGGLVSSDLGLETHMQTGQLDTSNINVGNMTILGGF